MKQTFKKFKLLSAVIILLSALFVPVFADDSPSPIDNDPPSIVNGDSSQTIDNDDDGDGDDDPGTIIGEIEMVDVEDVLGENGEPQSSDIDLQTYVPATVNLDIGPNGSVKHGNKVYSQNTSFETLNLTFYILPTPGYQIDHVYWNGKDVTNLVSSNGLLKIDDIEDGTLVVRFSVIPDESDNGGKGKNNTKTSDDTKDKALIYTSILALCLICFALTFIKTKKMHYLRKK